VEVIEHDMTHADLDQTATIGRGAVQKTAKHIFDIVGVEAVKIEAKHIRISHAVAPFRLFAGDLTARLRHNQDEREGLVTEQRMRLPVPAV